MRYTASESQEQEAFVQYFRLKFPKLLIHSDYGSGTRLSKKQASEQKRLNGGLRAWPDVFIAAVRHDDAQEVYSSGFFIEFKKTGTRLKKKDGTWADDHLAEQAKVLQQLNEQGYTAVFARGYDEAIKLLHGYFLLDMDGLKQLNAMFDYIKEGNLVTKEYKERNPF